MYRYIVYSFLVLFFVGCSNNEPTVASFISKESQLQTRQYQVKAYKTDKETLMRVAISTLQDDNYIIHHSDTKLGILTASKKEGKELSKLSMNVQEISKTNSKIRLNIEMSEQSFLGSSDAKEIDRVYYYYIFDRIAKSLFLEESLAPKKPQVKKRTILIKKEPQKVIRHHSIKSVVPKNMVTTTRAVAKPTTPVIATPKPIATPRVQEVDRNQKRVVTRDNRGEILRQSVNMVEEAPQEYYELAPNPNAPTMYYYNPQADQYEYINSGY
jgi:hypothetical protein